jgi:hypothetical protein
MATGRAADVGATLEPLNIMKYCVEKASGKFTFPFVKHTSKHGDKVQVLGNNSNKSKLHS